jgi:DNA-directed RNA polymerase subunit K/omega
VSESAALTPSAAPGATAGDVRLNRFHVAALAFQRSTQLQNGARPRVDAAGHKPTRLALLEVMADMISWSGT